MQAMPAARQQSFDEMYGPLENFLEIEVRLSSLNVRPMMATPKASSNVQPTAMNVPTATH